jgi:hypothetical protein
MADIAGSKSRYFTVFDAAKGYHQCPLDKESQLLTTFITPVGRYKFLRAPFGLSSISEHYDRRMYEAFQGLSDFHCIVDDVLMTSPVKSSTYASFYSDVRNKASLSTVTSFGFAPGNRFCRFSSLP